MLKLCYENEFNADVARNVLAEVDNLISGDYLMVGGTLLSCVRHGHFMPWDDDIDLLLHDDLIKELAVSEVFEKAGYDVEKDWYRDEHYVLQIVKEGILTDLWPFRVHPVLEGLFQTLGGDYPIDRTMPIRRIEFEGGLYPIPYDPYFYLDRNIGTNWRHEVRKRLTGHTSTLFSIEPFEGPIYLESLNGPIMI